MATNFPSSLDNSTTLPAEGATIPLSTNHVTAHQNIQDAIEAIEAKVGADSSAVTTSHDYKLSEVTGSDKAVGKTATQTLENKTLGTGTAIDLGSDAEGDIYYRNSSGDLTRLARGTDNYILKMNGNVPNWETETAVIDASTTVKGVVEAATSSEVTAGTATGGTGAVLAVTPDALAASTPVFNGSGLTNLTAVKKVSAVYTDVAISSTTTETTLVSQNIVGGTLSTGNGVRVRLFFSALNITATQTCTIRFKYGATTMLTITPATDGTFGAATNYSGFIDYILLASGATGTQNVAGTMSLGTLTGGAFRIGNAGGTQTGFSSGNTYSAQGTASEDSTADKTLAITAQFSNSGASDNLTMSLALVESIK